MATVQELKGVVKDTLENRGVLGQLKARIRAEVFNALDDQSESAPPLSNENLLVNELIREYLEFNKYKYTSSVLMAESGQPQTPLDRQFLVNELNLAENRESQSVPLLYGVVAHFLNRKGGARGRSPRKAVTPRSAGHSARTPRRHNPFGDEERAMNHGGDDEEFDGLSHGPFVVEGGRR
ncbi:centrosomal protein 20-like [Lineus longissimus]|uniref:centrosomal protein 20-like n=1 Tax=Lineus longissimus TaxID=88925 RepID=UPI002B4EC1DB